MAAAFSFGDVPDGKPPGWFDVKVTSGVEPSASQSTLKDAIFAARARIENELTDNPEKQRSALTELGALVKEVLIEASDPPEGGEDRIKKILADVGLDKEAPTATDLAKLAGQRPLAPGGWKVSLDVNSNRLVFTPPEGKVEPPHEQLDLVAEIARVARHLHSLYVEDRVVWPVSLLKPRAWELGSELQYLQRLLQIAQIGLGREYAQTSYARSALMTIEAEIFVLRGFAKRRWYLMKCALYAAIGMLVSLLFYSELICQPILDYLRSGACHRYRPIFLVLAGSMLGMWLSIASGRVATTLETLEQVINDPVGPGLRILFVLTVAFAGSVLLLSGMVQIKIGEFDTKSLGWDPVSALSPMITLLIGVFFGFSEKTLPTVLAKRASDFVQGLGAKA